MEKIQTVKKKNENLFYSKEFLNSIKNIFKMNKNFLQLFFISKHPLYPHQDLQSC